MRINNFYIINLFIILVTLITIYSFEFNRFINFAFKKNDEIHERINTLRFNHNQFTNAKNDSQSINFIKEFNYEKGIKSYANRRGRSSPLYFHHHWGLEKGKEIYDIKTNNIFRVSHQVQNYLDKKNINIYDKCHTQKNNNTLLNEDIEFTNGTSHFSMKNSNNLSNFLLFVELDIVTESRYISIFTENAKNNLIIRNEIDLTNNIHPIKDAYSTNIVNSANNIILLDNGSFGKTENQVKIWLMYYLEKYENFNIEIKPILNEDSYLEFFNNNDLNFETKLNNSKKTLHIINNKFNIINCKS
jgi:hypothetical protein